MSAVDQTITLSPVLPADPIVVCNAPFLHTLSVVEREVANIAVNDAPGAQAASTLLQRLTKAGSELEKARKELKAPFLAKGAEIDEAAKAPAQRIETAKTRIKQKVTAWQLDEQRKAREVEEARQDELRRLEALRVEEARVAKEKADRLAREAEENAAKLRAAATPSLDVDFDDEPAVAEPVQKTATEIAIEQIKHAPVVVAAKPSGLRFKCTLRIARIDVAKLPEPFVVRTANEGKIRALYCHGWKDGDPVPECAGVAFEIDRMPESTGRSAF